MTHKERTLSAFNHEPADQVPTYAFKSEMGFVEAWDERFDVKDDNWVQFGQDQTVLVELGIDATTEPSLTDRTDPEFEFKSYKIDDNFNYESRDLI